MTKLRTPQPRTLTTKKVWKVAIYLRLSQEDGRDESLSITNQRKIVLDYLDNQFSDDFEVVDTYIDDGISGITAHHRPEFLRMISDVESGRVDTVICKSLSRAFRNNGDQMDYLRKIFPQYKTRFITIDTPHLDTFVNPEKVYDLEIAVYGSFNEGYPLMISREINKTFKMMRETGQFLSSFAPYGYVKGDTDETKNKFFIDEDAAEIVRKIYHWYVYDGMSQLGIVKKLNSLGIPSPTVYKQQKGLKYQCRHQKQSGLWGISTVSRILKSESYLGHMVQGKQRNISPILKKSEEIPRDEWVVVENTHEPILDINLFSKAQHLQKKRRRTPKRERETDLFTSFLKCPDCGMSMRYRKRTAQNKHEEKTYQYYICSTFSMKSKDACSIHSIKREILEDSVLIGIQQHIKLVENLANVISNAEKNKVEKAERINLNTTLKDKVRQVEQLQETTDGLYLDWKTGVLSKNEYLRMKANFMEKISDLEQVIQNIQIEIKKQKENSDIVTPYLEIFQTHKNIKSLNRAILLDLIENIFVHDDGNITIEFKFSDIFEKIAKTVEKN